MVSIPNPEAVETEAAAPKRLSALRILAAAALCLLAACATVFAIFALVPEGNDYAQATRPKHERLATSGGRRIVLVGGSNLSFGVDSARIEERTGCTAVNMGMNGYFGVRYLLEEVKPDLRAGDIVVVSFEYDNFYKSVDGTADDLLVVTKANPAALGYLTFEQQLAMAARIPFVAQQKIIRLLDEGVGAVRLALLGEREPAVANAIDIVSVEGAASFNVYGDLVGHLDKEWTEAREQGVDMSATPIDPEVIGMIDSFARDMEARDIDVVISYSPVLRGFYERHESAFETLHAQMSAAPHLAIPRAPDGYVFEEDVFFDTVYHLDRDGRAVRTDRMIDDLMTTLGARADCRAGIAAQGEARE